MAVSTRCSKQGLIGDIYSSLQATTSDSTHGGSFEQWCRDLETISDEEWEQALVNLTRVALFSSLCLAQLLLYSSKTTYLG